MRKALKVLLGEEGEKRVRIGLAKDGSGVGGKSQNQSQLLIQATTQHYHIPLIPAACLFSGILFQGVQTVVICVNWH